MPGYSFDDTIFALASGQGRCGVAVIRLSGPSSFCIAGKLATNICVDRTARLARLYHPGTHQLLDHALVLGFKGPHSFTGEDVVEFHVHGGMAVIESVFDAISYLPDVRLAEPGEFSRRAFENGKMDLTEVEGLADLIDAETEAQKHQAVRQMQGELGQLYSHWRNGLIKLLAHIEATIDFAEEDIPDDLEYQAITQLENLLLTINDHLNDGKRGQRLREGVSVVIVGPPNAGKSSLLNAIAKRDAAIISSTPGTTRDIVDVHMVLSGVPVILSDTAGLRLTADDIEAQGVRRALDKNQQADLSIVLLDGGSWPDIDDQTQKLITEQSMVFVNKADLMDDDFVTQSYPVVSVKTGFGMDGFIEMLNGHVHEIASQSSSPVITRERHRLSLGRCVHALEQGLSVWKQGSGSELVAEDLRAAATELGRITGRVDVEDLLDVIFADFCIGK